MCGSFCMDCELGGLSKGASGLKTTMSVCRDGMFNDKLDQRNECFSPEDFQPVLCCIYAGGCQSLAIATSAIAIWAITMCRGLYAYLYGYQFCHNYMGHVSANVCRNVCNARLWIIAEGARRCLVGSASMLQAMHQPDEGVSPTIYMQYSCLHTYR